MRTERLCYFHQRWTGTHAVINEARTEPAPAALSFPVLEDHESIQMTIMQVMRMLTAGHLDTKTAGLLLYGLQIASYNLRYARFEPAVRENVVIDLNDVKDTPLEADQWSEEDEEEVGEERDEEEASDEAEPLSVKTGSAQATPKQKKQPEPAVSDAQFLKGLEALVKLQGVAEECGEECGVGIPARQNRGNGRCGTDTPVRQKPATKTNLSKKKNNVERAPSPAVVDIKACAEDRKKPLPGLPTTPLQAASGDRGNPAEHLQ